MKRSIALLSIASLAACGQQMNRDRATQSEDLRTFDVREEPPAARYASAENSGPMIGPTAAPGVAFNYRYAFRLPAQSIAAVQEQHAQACEKLGVNRCRITGLRYRLVNDRDIEGMLSFKLDPSIARQFGKGAVEAVARAEGMLVDSEISGVDAGSAIRAVDRTNAQLRDDLRTVETQLAKKNLSSEERTRLQQEAQRLREAIRANSSARDEQEESLATTPMTLQYGSGDLVPGFDTHSPVRNALKQAAENFTGGIAILFVILVTLLPWAMLLAFGWWLLRKFPRRRVAAPPVEAAETIEP